ncbi:hypothetical protein [Hyphomicrobium sp. 99]|uniref:hypothetical protein n=1 Tax=Hyphomicrobium sp. 99 TaxID=1163419 RepID=UPI0005F7E37D|nr:hypothetical protein [Hyphomicrobium sp. 99]
MTLKTLTNDNAATGLWIALIAALSIGGSLAFACAAPLAAIGALAGSKMKSGEGLALVAAAWLSNQIVGYGLLDYPLTADSFAWGAAIGVASIAAFLGARAVSVATGSSLVALAGAFLAAFAAYEAALYGAGFILGSSDEAFSMAVVERVLLINLASFAGLLVLHRAAVAISLIKPEAATPAMA